MLVYTMEKLPLKIPMNPLRHLAAMVDVSRWSHHKMAHLQGPISKNQKNLKIPKLGLAGIWKFQVCYELNLLFFVELL
jgi:hypothetical protein